jgi:hypothetical protein
MNAMNATLVPTRRMKSSTVLRRKNSLQFRIGTGEIIHQKLKQVTYWFLPQQDVVEQIHHVVYYVHMNGCEKRTETECYITQHRFKSLSVLKTEVET